MNKKISWGVVFVVFAIFYLIELRFPGLFYDIRKEISNLMFLNFEVVIVGIGVLLLLRRKIVLGLICIYIGGKMIFEYSKYFSPLFMLFVGIVYIFLGIKEKNGGKNE